MNIARVHAQLHAVSALGSALSGRGTPQTDTAPKIPPAATDLSPAARIGATGPAVVNRVAPTVRAHATPEARRQPDTLEAEQDSADETSAHDDELSEDEAAEVRKLKARDAEVRAHEQAHAAAGGGHTGSPSYETKVGPDGRTYAVGGEVPVDVSVVTGDPEATLQKMQQVKRAALAPANPSSADRAVAAKASAQAAAAAREIEQQRTETSEAAADALGKGDTSQRRAAQNAYAPPAPPTLGSMVNLQSCGKCGGSHAM